MEKPCALLNDGSYESQLKERDRKLAEAEAILNAELDARLVAAPHKHPKAVWYIIPNEFAERFCYYGVTPLLLNYFQYKGDLSETDAKMNVHLFKMFGYFFPLLGAAISDSWLAKYHTIVYLSFVYFIGVALLAVFSFPNLLGPLPLPYASMFVPLMLIAVGTGGIKPCVSSHGGDQYLPSQTQQLSKFFAWFYTAINVGSLVSGLAVPEILKLPCFGSDDCYPIAFGVPAVVFLISLSIFVAGKRTYRIVPAAGTFLPWIAVKATFTAVKCWAKASPEERKAKRSWIDFARESYGVSFVDELRLLGKVLLMILPYTCFWMIYDQGFSEWQEMYNHMDKRIGNWELSAEQSSTINSIFIIILLPIFANVVYPFMNRRGWKTRPLARMMVGFLLAIAAFGYGAGLQEQVDHAFADALAKGTAVQDDKKRITACVGCIHGLYQVPAWFILTAAEVLVSPTGLEFVYTEVGPRFRAVSSALWLLTVSLGNLIVVNITAAIGTSIRTAMVDLIYCAVGFVALVIAFCLSYWCFVYKEDRTDLDSLMVQGGLYDSTDNAHGHLKSAEMVLQMDGCDEVKKISEIVQEKQDVLNEKKELEHVKSM